MFAYFHVTMSWRELARRTVAETFDDGCIGLAAQLAFYFMLALFPALLFLVVLLSYLPVDTALAPMLARLEAVVPREMIGLIRGQLSRAVQGASGGLLTFGMASAIWSSSAAMSAIITALNRAYDIEEWRSWWRVRLLAISLTIALALFIVTAFGLVIGGSSLAGWVARQAGLGHTFQVTWALLQWPLVLLLVLLAVNLVYHFAPNSDAQWRGLTPGSMLA
ncbi:MAG: YihY/virulence factor BrkB family protein, partial [Vicinamibacterales bacterium]